MAISDGSLTGPGVSFSFGSGTPYSLTGFTRGGAASRAADRDRPRGDGRSFGRDLKSGPTHSLGILVEGDPADRERSVGERMAVLERAWDAAVLRSMPGELARLQVGDRFAYGRPRDLEVDDSGRWDGTGEYTLTFDAESTLWYGAEEVTVIRFAPPVGGGLRFPARSPFRFNAGPSVRNGSVVVTGREPTWPVFEIAGPVTNPEVDIVGIGKLQFNVALAADQRLVVDTRPWARWVKRGYLGSDLAAFPGALAASGLRLSDVSLAPGAYQVLLRGFDPTGTAELRVSTAPAFPSF